MGDPGHRPGASHPFYADDMAFDRSDQWSKKLTKIFLDRGPDRGYLLETSKYLFIEDLPTREAVMWWEFEVEVRPIKLVSRGRYLGSFMRYSDELEYLVRPLVESWVQGVCTFDKTAILNTQLDYAGLGIQLQLE